MLKEGPNLQIDRCYKRENLHRIVECKNQSEQKAICTGLVYVMVKNKIQNDNEKLEVILNI